MGKLVSASGMDFLSPISLIPGLGPKRVLSLNESGIESIGDLLYYFPRRYVDRTLFVPLNEAGSYLNKIITVKGKITQTRLERGRKSRFRVLLTDDSGSIELLWFQGVRFYSADIKNDMKLIVTGKVNIYGKCQMVHPMIEKIKDEESERNFKSILPSYTITSSMREAGIQNRILIKSLEWVLNNLAHYPQILPSIIETEKNFPPLRTSLQKIHFPDDLQSIETFRMRIKYEELYKTALTVYLNKRKFASPGRKMVPGELFDKFIKSLPFSLTPDQKKAVGTLFADAASCHRMHRLLQGDVGSGKTLVAFCACLPALNEGFQVAWMAPTEVLARQTFNIISKWLESFGIKTGLLISGLPPIEKQRILSSLSSNELRFVIGTHALLQPAVEFKQLAMVVIDEQHKFGARQRSSLHEKDTASDFLLMSATPIPQTLARTIYGDLDIVSIFNRPGGRIPVSTHIVPDEKRTDMEQFVLKRIQEGDKVFYIVPRIEQEDELESPALNNIETAYEHLTKGTFSAIRISCVHGKMTSDEKEKVMHEFAHERASLLLATQVVEVGIDVPDAAIIIIENAEMFGLAQLHQLRGRVGRGTKKSYCFLLPGHDIDEIAKKRLSAFCKEHDGFKIAEMDLRFRGPGQISGYKQSGWDDLAMTDILNDVPLFREIQVKLENILTHESPR